MKILYFTPYYPPQSEAAATRAFWFVKTLEEAGHKVEVISQKELFFNLSSNKSSALKRLFCEILMGIELFIKLLLKKNYDRYVLSSPPFFTVYIGCLALRLKGMQYLLDIRDLYPEVFFEMGLIKENSLVGKLAKKLASGWYQATHHVITVTEGLRAEIKKYGIPQEKIELARNGYDSELFKPGKEKFEKFTLVFHGTLGKAQNIKTLLSLAKVLEDESDIEIIVAGDGPKAAEIVSAQRGNIRYLGNLSYQEIPKLLQKCHVGLSFRTDDKIGREAFPVKVFEYIGCELPIILSPKCEAGEMIEKDELGWQFGNEQIKEMKNKIISIKKETPNLSSSSYYTRQEQSKKILALI
ncbi:MAG: glycosyltransferase family 4 protein [Bacteriovoracaceae bacterium]